MNRRPRRFRTKLVIVAGASLLVGLGASVIASLIGMRGLADESTRVVGDGLDQMHRAYLSQYAEDTVLRTESLFAGASSELEILADAMQMLIDQRDELAGAETGFERVPLFHVSLERTTNVRAFQNRPGAGSGAVAAVWGPLVEGDRGPRPDIAAHMTSTSPINLVLASVGANGTEKLQVYYVGPERAGYMRMWPWVDVVDAMDRLYPGYMDQGFWDFFFPGIIEGWKAWASSPARLQSMPSQITYTAPYEDAAGGGVVVTLLRPVWEKDRHTFAGALGLDLTLAQVSGFIEDVQLAETGFAFLAQQNGNVLAVNAHGQEVLGLRPEAAGGNGVSMLNRKLAGSADPAIAELHLPAAEGTEIRDVTIRGVQHKLLLRRLPAFNVWSGDGGIHPESWTLGFVVPQSELDATVAAARAAIQSRTRGFVYALAAGSVVTFLVMLLGIALISKRVTSALGALASAADRIMRKEYDARVTVRSNDELAQLGSAFNAMADEVRHHMANLERLVAERTADLRRANDEISVLNRRLEAENDRLGAEIEVAREIQMMVLPNQRELRDIDGLDVVGYMKPASEVGGDYYDVVRNGRGVTIGIGDVTGHGLESGVLMLMLQTAVRTLLAADEQDPCRILAVVNKVLYQNMQRGNLDHSATVSLLAYQDGRVWFTGQHEELIVVRAQGVVERIDTIDLGFPVGIEFDISRFLARIDLALAAGDVLVLYTDGITEAENAAKEQYGIERVCEVVQHNRRLTAVGIKDAILDDVRGYIGGQPVFDDITLVVAKRT